MNSAVGFKKKCHDFRNENTGLITRNSIHGLSYLDRDGKIKLPR